MILLLTASQSVVVVALRAPFPLHPLHHRHRSFLTPYHIDPCELGKRHLNGSSGVSRRQEQHQWIDSDNSHDYQTFPRISFLVPRTLIPHPDQQTHTHKRLEHLISPGRHAS